MLCKFCGTPMPTGNDDCCEYSTSERVKKRIEGMVMRIEQSLSEKSLSTDDVTWLEARRDLLKLTISNIEAMQEKQIEAKEEKERQNQDNNG